LPEKVDGDILLPEGGIVASVLESRVARTAVLTLLFVAAWVNSVNPYFWGVDDYEWLDLARAYPAKGYFLPSAISKVDVPERPGAKVLLVGRPLVRALFSLEYRVYRENALGYHLTNVIIHFLSLILVYRIASLLVPQGAFAFISACLFAIFPRHSESVTWISGRCDLVMGLFFFLAVYFFLLFLKSSGTWRYLLALFAVGFALLSKETAVGLPPLLFGASLLRPCGGQLARKKILLLSLPFFLLLGGYLLWRLSLQPGAYSDIYLGKSFLQLSALVGLNAGHYIANLAVPVNYEALLGGSFWGDFVQWGKSLLHQGAGQFLFIGAAVLIATLLVFLFAKGRRFTRFLILWLVFSLAVALPIFGERLLYVPSAAFLMFVAALITRGISDRRRFLSVLSAACFAILGGLYMFSTIQKNANFERAGKIDYRIAADIERILPEKAGLKYIFLLHIPVKIGRWPYVISNFGARTTARVLRGKDITLRIYSPEEYRQFYDDLAKTAGQKRLVLFWNGRNLRVMDIGAPAGDSEGG